MVASQGVRVGARSRASVPSIQPEHITTGVLDLPFVYAGEIEPSISPTWYSPIDYTLDKIVLSLGYFGGTGVEVYVHIGNTSQFILLESAGPVVVQGEGQQIVADITKVQVEVVYVYDTSENLDVQLRLEPA